LKCRSWERKLDHRFSMCYERIKISQQWPPCSTENSRSKHIHAVFELIPECSLSERLGLPRELVQAMPLSREFWGLQTEERFEGAHQVAGTTTVLDAAFYCVSFCGNSAFVVAHGLVELNVQRIYPKLFRRHPSRPHRGSLPMLSFGFHGLVYRWKAHRCRINLLFNKYLFVVVLHNFFVSVESSK